MLMQVAVVADDFWVEISGKLVYFLRNVHGNIFVKVWNFDKGRCFGLL